MKTRLIFAVFGWLAAGLACFGGTADLYVNDDSISDPVQVDARVFLNRGTMNFNGLSRPYDTQNTLYFTNTGTMGAFGFSDGAGNYFSLGGFRLDHTDGTTGTRGFASVINNLQGALIDGEPFLSLSATNLVNRGNLVGSLEGLIRLNGQNVDLANSKLDMGTLSDGLNASGGSQTRTNFTPMQSVTDISWGTNIVTLDPTQFFKYAPNGVQVTTPDYIVDPGQFPDGMSLTAPLVFVNTNSFGDPKGPTNQIIEVVFVANTRTNVSVDVSFGRSSEQGNPFHTFITKFSGFDTNVITRQRVSRSIFLTDRLASATNLLVAADTNLFLLTNSLTLGTFRPANFRIERFGLSGAPGNSLISSNIFTQFVSPQFTNGMNFSNATVTPFFSAYEAFVNSNLQLPGNGANVALTNYAGRVEINADNLNLNNTRIRAGGAAFIKTKNLTGSANLVVDVPNLFYDLGATNGNLILQGLAGAPIIRFASGDIKAWSAIWTNGFDQLTTNNTVDPNTGATNTDVVTTNFTTMYHVLLVSADLSSDDGVTSVSGLKAVATNTTVADKLLIDSTIELHSDSLTINGTLFVGNIGSGVWNAASAPELRRLTNNGILAVQGVANFGRDRAPYDTFVNTGTNESLSMSIGATTLYNAGTIQTFNGPIDIVATSVQLDGTGSKITAFGDLYLTASDLKMQGATLTAGRSIQLQIANSFLDAGAGAPNRIASVQGFTLGSKPTTATMLGTTFEASVTTDGSADILWPAADLGATKEGFANNAAIGRLSLISDINGLINIAGINGGKALYVDFLEFSSPIAADMSSFIQIADDFTIYFADSNIPVEQLDGALNGHLKWVRNFAGPFSGIDVALADGRTVRVNRNVFNSTVIDSDSDGIANAFDPEPFGGVPITTAVVNVPPLTTQISWTGAPQTSYRVEKTSSLNPTTWVLVTTVSNTSTDSAPLVASDPVNPDQPVVYYRVTYEP